MPVGVYTQVAALLISANLTIAPFYEWLSKVIPATPPFLSFLTIIVLMLASVLGYVLGFFLLISAVAKKWRAMR